MDSSLPRREVLWLKLHAWITTERIPEWEGRRSGHTSDDYSLICYAQLRSDRPALIELRDLSGGHREPACSNGRRFFQNDLFDRLVEETTVKLSDVQYLLYEWPFHSAGSRIKLMADFNGLDHIAVFQWFQDLCRWIGTINTFRLVESKQWSLLFIDGRWMSLNDAWTRYLYRERYFIESPDARPRDLEPFKGPANH